MAKKGKKFDAEVEQAEHNSVQEVVNQGVMTQEGETPVDTKVRAAPIYLEDSETGVQYKFDRRDTVLKKATSGTVKVNGEDVPIQITSNKGWAKDEDYILEYIWLVLPNEGGYGYITLDYKQNAVEFAAGRSFTVGSGKPNRDNPVRVGGEGEVRRKEAFIKKMAEKKQVASGTQEEQPQA